MSDFSNLQKYELAVLKNQESFIQLISSIFDYHPDMVLDIYFSSSHVKIVLTLGADRTTTDTIDNNVFMEWYNGLRNTSKL